MAARSARAGTGGRPRTETPTSGSPRWSGTCRRPWTEPAPLSHSGSEVRQGGRRCAYRDEVVMSTSTKNHGFTDAEKAAMKARVDEMRSAGRGGTKKADEAEACLDAIAAMPDDDRRIAERVHTLISETAPAVRPKTWYGMPAYVDENGKVVCFFKPAAKFGARYATLGFNDVAQL